MRFSAKRALITGAATGIGRATAMRLASEGAQVAIHYHDDALEPAAREVLSVAPPGSLLVKADIASEADVHAMFEKIDAAFQGLDILVNNSGILGPLAEGHATETEAWDRVLAVNLRGAFLCCREALRLFLRDSTRGVIVNNSSVHQLIPKPKYLPYSISKGGLDNLTRSLALEYAGRGIRINAVGPGAVLTSMNDAWRNDADARRSVESHIPVGRAAEPEEIAAVFAFLASDEASYITGQTLHACGGLTLYPEFRSAWASGE